MKSSIYLLTIIAAAFCTSCSSQRYSYSPPAFINPLLSEKGQTELSANYSTGPSDGTADLDGLNNGLDAHAAYAISDKFALITSYSWRQENDSYYEEWNVNGIPEINQANVKYKRDIVQVGTLYSHLFRKKKSGFSLGILFGFLSNKSHEFGKKDSEYFSEYFDSRGSMLAIQPAFNFNLKKSLKWSLISRFNIVNPFSVNTSLSKNQLFEAGLLNLENEVLFYSAIGTTIKYTVKDAPWLSFNSQFMFSSSGETEKYMRYARGWLYSGGISVDLSKIKKTAK